MPSTTSFKVGDIVSVNFPYSDLQGYKRRPGLVLHFDQQDLLLARITTQPASTPTDISITQWAPSGLPRPSTIKLAKLASIDQRLIHKIVGRLHPSDSASVMQTLNDCLQKLHASLSA